MARDKAKDDEYFNCSQEHEFTYVSGLYDDSDSVYTFLKEGCGNKSIYYSTHSEVYQMIDSELGFPAPN